MSMTKDQSSRAAAILTARETVANVTGAAEAIAHETPAVTPVAVRPQNAEEMLEQVRRQAIEVIDLRITDLFGRWHHLSIPADQLDKETFTDGIPFDSSSIPGFRQIQESDMIMVPDPTTAFRDPFTEAGTMSVACDVYEPSFRRYERDPRAIAQRAEEYLRQTGIATASHWGPELEFFIFDDVNFYEGMNRAGYELFSSEADWNDTAGGTAPGYRVRPKHGYFPVAPTDQLQDVRTAMVRLLRTCGISVERHHHEVATAGQAEINFRFDTLTRTADNVQIYKYIVKNTARMYGKTATFMPKPLYGDNGSGMHTHQSLSFEENPIFYDVEGYAGLSSLAQSYVAGLLLHASAILGLSNASTNSYKRLVPGYEAPVNLVYAEGNRSAAVRVPIGSAAPKAKRIEFRPPDATGNAYLDFAAMLMAGLDGIMRRLDPVELSMGPVEENVYALSPEKQAEIAHVPGSLEEALDALERDHEFLLRGGVFSEDLIQTWITTKRREEVDAVRTRPHPHEFYLYFDI